jgi:hypothetical protein
MTRADVVRLLLTHALNATKCRVEVLLAATSTGKRKRAAGMRANSN